MSARAMTRNTFSGVGSKKRKLPQRKPCGRLSQPTPKEREQDVMAVVLDQPHRRGLSDPRTEYAVGRLHLFGFISHEQHDALRDWTRLFLRHQKTQGLPRAKFPSLMAREIASEGSPAVEDPDRAMQVAEDYERASRAIYEAFGVWSFQVGALLTGVCVMDRAPNLDEVERIKRAADVLAGVFGIER